MTTYYDLVAVLRRGTDEQVEAVLLGLSPAERKALGPPCRRWLTHGSKERISNERNSLAVLATADGARQARVALSFGWGLDDAFVARALRILQARQPSWLPGFGESILDEEASLGWRMTRALVRAELVPTPTSPNYYLGTTRGLPAFAVGEPVAVLDRLNEDPGLIGGHLLTMLACEGAGRQLARHDAYLESAPTEWRRWGPQPSATWRAAFVALASDGRLDRGALLDAILAAPLRDWAAADLGWYVAMHEALGPSVDEVVERQGTYARLLTVENGPSVKLAQVQLKRILADPRLDPAPVLDASRATLGRTDKATVAAQLKLLAGMANVVPAESLADVVAMALDHPRSDVRESAQRLLSTLGAEPAAVATEPAPFEAPAPQPWPAKAAVLPVASAEELGELLLTLLAEFEPLEMERAVDGLLRFAGDRPRTADLLLARAAGQVFDADPRMAVGTLVRAWLTPRRRFRDGDWHIVLARRIFPARAADPASLVGALGRRFTDIAFRLRAGGGPAVALPTYADGSLDADVLSGRLQTIIRDQPGPLEVALGLLRVAPSDRSAVALPAALRRTREVRRVLELGQGPWHRHVVDNAPHSWDKERRVVVMSDSSATSGGALDGILPCRRPPRDLLADHEYGEYEPRFEQILGSAALLLPHNPDALSVQTQMYQHRDLVKDRASCVPVLDALARSRSPLGAPGAAALALGLAAKDGRARVAAVDAGVDRARYGALDGVELGRQAALLLADGVVIGQRLSGGLSEIARAHDAATVPVLTALGEILGVLAGRRDAAQFLELTADLAERTGRRVSLPAELCDIAMSGSTSAVAKAARRLA